MSSLSKKTKSSQQSTSTSDLTDLSKQQFNTGQEKIRGVVNNFNAQPYDPFDGPMVADLSADEQTAREQARNLAPRDAVQYRTFEEFDPATYYNPFEKEVVDATGAYYDEALQKNISQNQARATMNKSYGGSRHGVAEGELMRTSGMDKTKMMADMRYKGYNDAADRFERDSGNMYQADTRNSDAEYNDSVQAIEMLTKLGAGEREIEQAKMLAEKAKHDEQYADAWKRFQVQLQTEMGLFSATPLLTTNKSSGSSTSKTSDPLGELGTVVSTVGDVFKMFPGTK
jgi:hypothetical protein